MVWVIHSQILDLIILYNSWDGMSKLFPNIGSNNILERMSKKYKKNGFNSIEIPLRHYNHSDIWLSNSLSNLNTTQINPLFLTTLN